jgi:hypothetical protein
VPLNSALFGGLHPSLRPAAEWLVSEWRRQGGVIEVTSVFRTLEKQTALRKNYELCLARGLVGQDISLAPNFSCKWPANRPGDSGHNFGLAWDSWVPDESMPTWIAWRRWQGWTVPENDVIHAELPNWRTYVEAVA